MLVDIRQATICIDSYDEATNKIFRNNTENVIEPQIYILSIEWIHSAEKIFSQTPQQLNPSYDKHIIRRKIYIPLSRDDNIEYDNTAATKCNSFDITRRCGVSGNRRVMTWDRS